jgi:hypothetical protein
MNTAWDTVFSYTEVNSMRIDATNNSYAGQYARPSGVRAAPSFSATMSEAMEKYSGQVDFTNMTRQELIDWMSGQLRSGEMKFEESLPIFLMTVRGGADVPEDARYNFIQEAREGIEWAVSHNDKTKLEWLESCLEIMQKAMSESR